MKVKELKAWVNTIPADYDDALVVTHSEDSFEGSMEETCYMGIGRYDEEDGTFYDLQDDQPEDENELIKAVAIT